MKRANICRWKLIFYLCLFPGMGQAQEREYFRVVFYNVENLFDTRNDSLKADDDFTPRGKQHWNRERYNQKIVHISKALLAAGGASVPVIIGLAEVENRGVLVDLCAKTGLVVGDYGIIHADSPDPRGIDVALLYQKSRFKELKTRFFPVRLKGKEKTRDILYCEGISPDQDTLHFFVCHFPSMRGGESPSEWKRIEAASVLKEKVDSIQAVHPGAMIVIMGDLNGKANTMAQKALGVQDPETREIAPRGLYNTGYYLLRKNRGSYRYKGEWQTLDHIIVSGVLLDGRRVFHASRRMGVCEAEFLLEEERQSFGIKPRSTYRGPRYIGGYSDHLPVFIDLKK